MLLEFSVHATFSTPQAFLHPRLQTRDSKLLFETHPLFTNRFVFTTMKIVDTTIFN